MRTIAFGALAADFVQHLREVNLAPATIRLHEANLHRFLEYLDEVGVSDIRAVTRATLWTYATTTMARPWAPQTKVWKLATVRRFFRLLKRRDRILVDPSPVLPRIKVPDSLPRVVMTRDEVNLVLAQPELRTRTGFRDRAILETFYSTAIRLSELRQLTIYDIDLADGMLRVNQGKGRKDRIVPLGKVAGKFVAEYLKRVRPRLAKEERPERALFLSYTGRPLTGGTIGYLVRLYARRATVAKRVTCHTFRHTCATEMLRNGSSIRYVQELLGHADISTTQIYTRLLPLDLVKAHARAHPRERQSPPCQHE
jgi:integrase/recombinase XerD